MKTRLFFSFFLFLLFFSCKKAQQYDLAITNVNIFDSVNKKVIENKTVLINADTISAIIPAGNEFTAIKVIDGKGKLVTPGFFDTHTHLGNVLGDYEKAPVTLRKDSINSYKQRIAETFIPYGVTTIKDVGQPEKWVVESVKWQKNPNCRFPDFFICGSAIISDEERTPYMNHVEVKDPQDAAKKIEAYFKMGIRYLKLYSRLRTPEFKAALKKANELNMNTCAHVEYNVPIDSAMTFGLKRFEHLLTLQSSVLNSNEDWYAYTTAYEKNYKKRSFIPPLFEAFRYIEEDSVLNARMIKLIDRMASEKIILSTTIHILASYINRSYFRTYIVTRQHTEEEPEMLTPEERKRFNEDYDIMMKYLKRMHDKGVKITMGTDCMDGGKAFLSEMLLLKEAGFTTEDILQIATYNGAVSMGLENKSGSIQVGKKANLVIFEKNPFEEYKNFLSPKIVIKDGKQY
ncbi:MAG TPA: amidohydrolase family protein [Flavobacteriales bacterium]|nr:amidohydrolase family protein [Flavobacteriales bacterium]